MESPDLYRRVAFLPKRDTSLCLKEFTVKNRWKENSRIIDIGCGDGSTNKEVLQKFVPTSFKVIVGCDISLNMINYARENFAGERIEYVQWDVSQELPHHLTRAFDHAFSFYALHWVKQQRTAFLNIYNALADGGNCLLLFLGRYTVYEVFRILSRTQKWRTDLKDVDLFTSPYYDSQDPENDVTVIMKEAGFKDVEVNVMEKTHVYDVDTFKSLIKAVNPFNVLNERWDDFMSDYFAEAPNGPTVDYHLIVAYGCK